MQEHVERVLSKVADENIEIICAGRTDTGVHASGQVIHFDTSSERSSRGWLLGANSDLPEDINVTWAQSVSDDFHARFSATSRSYQYLILNRFERSALHRNRAWWVYDPLQIGRMQEAAEALVGEHDFSAYRAAACQASTAVREISHLSLTQRGPWISLEVTANAFLQHMVRNITGTLVTIGRSDESPEWAAEILESRDRKKGGIAAPPHGLTLVSVGYPDEFDLPADPNAKLR